MYEGLSSGKILHMQNARHKLLLTSLAISALIATPSANAWCWEAASEIYGIPGVVLEAVAHVESKFNSAAFHRNENGTYDIGMMQINSSWLPKLEKYEITEDSLKDACTNVKVGAWILANNVKELGWNWNAIGAYNVGCAKLSAAECDRRRYQYAWKIYTAMNRMADTATRKPRKEIPSYERGATALSSIATHPEEPIAANKKIMVVQLASIELFMPNGPQQFVEQGGDTSIGGFLNYADERGDE